MDTEQTNLSLEQVLGVLRRRAPWILLCFVLVGVAAYGFSKHQTKKYTATASLVFSNNQLEPAGRRAARLSVASNQQAQQNTNLKLVQLGDMAAKTASAARAGADEGRGQRGSERERAGGIEHRQRRRHRDLAGARGRYREHLHRAVRQGAAEQQPRLLRLRTCARQQAVGGASPAAAGWDGWAGSGGSRAVAGDPRRTAQRQRPGRAGRDGSDVAFLAEGFEEHGPRGVLGPAARAWASRSCSSASTGGSGSRRIWRRSTVCRCSVSSLRAPRCLVSARRRRNAREALPSSEAEAFHLIRAHLRYFNVDRELQTLLVASAGPGRWEDDRRAVIWRARRRGWARGCC